MSIFRSIIWDFYKLHKRSFPWRETTNPYFIFLSEVMLQQTQTSRVVEKYHEFIAAFPTVESLAQAPFSSVLGHWSGLGYNRRAKFLHAAAHIIVNQFDGVIPRDPELLDALPGIGSNTAAAIVVYAYNTPLPFIETNIRRIFIHHFFEDSESVSDTELIPLITEALDTKNPREWYWALMDYGAQLPKVVVNPNRKSKHYTKQSTFVGSVRQVRGSVLKKLLTGALTERELATYIEGNVTHLPAVLISLEKEGFITKKGNRYALQ